MNVYTLSRVRSGIGGTFGIITDEDGVEICKTVELPWCSNEPDKSCVPVGMYICKAYASPRHGDVWMLQDVPNRSNCEIHAANTINDLLGCIGVGDEFGIIDRLPAVLNSQTTLAVLRHELPSIFQLTISENLRRIYE